MGWARPTKQRSAFSCFRPPPARRGSSSSASAATAWSTPDASPSCGPRRRATWRRPSIRCREEAPEVIAGADVHRPGGSAGGGRTDRRGGHRRTDRRACPAGRDRADRRRRRPAREATGGDAGRLPPPARGRAADRTGGPGRLPESRLGRRSSCSESDAYGIGEMPRVGAVGRVVSKGGLLEPFAVGGPPKPARPAGRRRRGHQSAGPRRGHRARRRRLSPADDVVSVETDLYRANNIDSDDTSVVRITHGEGRVVTCAFTLCAPDQQEPVVQVEGSHGRADFYYTTDRIEAPPPTGRPARRPTARKDLLENLLAHRREGRRCSSRWPAPERSCACSTPWRDADEPVSVDPRAIDWRATGPDRRPVVDGVETGCRRRRRPGGPSPSSACPGPIASGTRCGPAAVCGEHEVAAYRDGRGTMPTSSPRPVPASRTHPGRCGRVGAASRRS